MKYETIHKKGLAHIFLQREYVELFQTSYVDNENELLHHQKRQGVMHTDQISAE